MGFNCTDVSHRRANRALYGTRSAPRRNNHYDPVIDGSGGHTASFPYVHRKKGDVVHPVSEVEELGIDKELNCVERLSDDTDFMRLSSNCEHPSMISSDGSHEHFSSILSLSGKDVTYDGSAINSIDEASMVLDGPLEGSDGVNSEEEVALWLQNADRTAVCSESGDSSYGRSLGEDSSLFESSSASLSTEEDSPLFIQDFDRTCIWVSSVDLDLEDSEFVQDENQGFDVFGSDFPSPSYGAWKNHRLGSSRSGSVTSIGQSTEVESSSEVCDSDEPIFWPFDQKSYRLPEFEKNFLCLSPRKRGIYLEVQGPKSPKPVRLRVQKNNPSTASSKNMRKECRRKIVFSPPQTLSAGKLNNGISINKNIQNVSMSPSRFSRSSQVILKKCPSNVSMKGATHLLDAHSQKHTCDDTPLLELEAGDFHVMGVSIEESVGLIEFDGHEGLDEESEEGDNILYGSPFKTTVFSKG